MNYSLRNQKIFESFSFNLYGNADIIDKLGEIEIYDAKKKETIKISASDIIKVCTDAAYMIYRDYPYLFKFMQKCKIMYIPGSGITRTMCVDNYNNLWINMGFVYNQCNMNPNRIFGILFHEIFHILLNHISRGFKKFPYEYDRRQNDMIANLCMDLEVNSSMVEDKIVTDDFWSKMSGMYDKKYTGMTWEEIYDQDGKKLYDEWRSQNNLKLDDRTQKILDKLSDIRKTIDDPNATEDEKKQAAAELNREMDKIFGIKKKTLYNVLDKYCKSRLSGIGDLSVSLDDLRNSLSVEPEDMTPMLFDTALDKVDAFAADAYGVADKIGNEFSKSQEDVENDLIELKKVLMDVITDINKNKPDENTKRDLVDSVDDAFDDLISNDIEKERSKKTRQEREDKKKEKREKEKKKNNALWFIVNVLRNLKGLREYGRIGEKTAEMIDTCITNIEPLSEKKYSDISKYDLKDSVNGLDELRSMFLPDLTALIDDGIILDKTEQDMEKFLDDVFKFVFSGFKNIVNSKLTDDEKTAVIKDGARKLRTLGKILKTQKAWIAGDDFKKAYKETMSIFTRINHIFGNVGMFDLLWHEPKYRMLRVDKKYQNLVDDFTNGEVEVPHFGKMSVLKFHKIILGISDFVKNTSDENRLNDFESEMVNSSSKGDAENVLHTFGIKF